MPQILKLLHPDLASSVARDQDACNLLENTHTQTPAHTHTHTHIVTFPSAAWGTLLDLSSLQEA